jgi:hypothetical protein
MGLGEGIGAMLFFKSIFSPVPPRITCPPGTLTPGQGGFIVVASLPRSGTHLLIDAILNNFGRYKRRPLYVDLDKYFNNGQALEALLNTGGYVVKTHFPTFGLQHEHAMRRLLERAVILTPVRPMDQVYRSARVYGSVSDHQELAQQAARFDCFWQPYERLLIPFAQLVDTENYPLLIKQIGQFIGAAPNAKVVYPLAKKHIGRVKLLKLLTRVLGNRCPVVNTTIAFAKTR